MEKCIVCLGATCTHESCLQVHQAEALCHKVSAFLSQSGLSKDSTPVILGGDFNSYWRKYHSDKFDTLPAGVPHLTSGVYELLSTGNLDGEHHDHPNQRGRVLLRHTPVTACGLKLKSAFSDLHGHEPALTTRTADFEGTLDYIWLSQPHFKVTGTLPFPFSDDAKLGDITLAPCPNDSEPSDHLSVTCDVELLPA